MNNNKDTNDNNTLENDKLIIKNNNSNLSTSLTMFFIECNKKLVHVINDLVKASIPTLKITTAFNTAIGNVSKRLNESSKKLAQVLTINIKDFSPKLIELAEVIKKAQDNPDSLINWINYTEKLSNYIWTLPFDMSSLELKEIIESVCEEKEFDKKMQKYFTKSKIESLFCEIEKDLPRKHLTMYKQIKHNFYNENYAIANIGIMSMIDDLISYFLYNKGQNKRKDLLMPLIEKIDMTSTDNFEVLPIMMLNSNLNIIFEDVPFSKTITINTNKKARRNPCLHGKTISNRKIDFIMLLNTLFYLITIIKAYSKYKDSIIFIHSKTHLYLADFNKPQEIERFYLRKKYARKSK